MGPIVPPGHNVPSIPLRDGAATRRAGRRAPHVQLGLGPDDAAGLGQQHPDPAVLQRPADSEGAERFVLGIAAEGTGSEGEYWKSGFYRIAQQSDLPITMAFLDAPSRTVGWGPTFSPTGNVSADMDRVREFYADKTGLKPEGFTPPRPREERG